MIILASASPRRQELLRFITNDFTVFPADVNESFDPGADPKKLVEALSLKKALSVFRSQNTFAVIGADTVVWLNGRILGKPCSLDEAAEMLRGLSGKTHTVFTGVSIVSHNIQITFSTSANVSFLTLSEKEITDYIATGEPLDKAGAYGIQGKGALFISGIEGDFYTVMGLPVALLNRELLALGLI